PYYEVEGYYNNREVELKVDEATGQIVGKEVKGYAKASKTINVQNIIIPEVAETKALEKVGSDFQTMEWTVERENGRAVYKFDMTTGGDKKAEVKVDGMNGKVLSAKVKTTKY
ncbi:MAG: Peptidase propeptide and YPEB protein, partial [Veillonella sp. DORA_A_3_16_22]